jgi:hypothetical protein
MMDDDGLYVAGHPAPPGRYRRVGAPDGREVVLEHPDVLPASLDGHVAVYLRAEPRRPGSLEGQSPSAAGQARGRLVGID